MPHPQSAQERGRLATVFGTLLFASFGLGLVPALGPPRVGGQSGLALGLEPIVTGGLRNPVYLTHAGDASGRLFVVEQPGRIRIVRNGRLLDRPFLDISGRVRPGGERGLLGLAFHPAYRRNGRYVVNYTRQPDGATVVAEYRVSRNPDVSRATERLILVVSQPYGNHNGGMVAFGPDGFLYIGLGDGGSGGDPGNRAQNLNELLGKILRIDIDSARPYAIPPDNPFAARGRRPEIFAYGLRNPWRFSFDRETGTLWVADVGQNDWEEIDIVRRGGNYGWRIMEGAHCFSPRARCPARGLLPPVAEYRNQGARCSITGGYVYRGALIPSLVGTYVYGDYCSGEIFGFVNEAQHVLLTTTLRIASFGQDQAGELYVVGHGGTVHRLIGARGWSEERCCSSQSIHARKGVRKVVHVSKLAARNHRRAMMANQRRADDRLPPAQSSARAALPGVRLGGPH